MPTKNWDESMVETFREDPKYALALLDDILSDGDQGELLVFLRQLTKAFGGMQKVAEEAGLNPTQLYRTLSQEGNPSLNSMIFLLKAMGLRLAIRPIESTGSEAA